MHEATLQAAAALTAAIVRSSMDDPLTDQFLRETNPQALRLLKFTGSRLQVAADLERLVNSYDTRLAIIQLLDRARPTARPGLLKLIRIWWLAREGG